MALFFGVGEQYKECYIPSVLFGYYLVNIWAVENTIHKTIPSPKKDE